MKLLPAITFTNCLQAVILLVLAGLLFTKYFTRMVVDKTACEYATVALVPHPASPELVIERNNLPPNAVHLITLNDGNGAETLSEAAYYWMFNERFWYVFTSVCAALIVMELLKRKSVPARRLDFPRVPFASTPGR